jgi:hypothetical protein
MAEPEKRIECEVYSRVVGFYRPVSNWNKGKQQEWKDRKAYKLPEGMDEKTSVRGSGD